MTPRADARSSAADTDDRSEVDRDALPAVSGPSHDQPGRTADMRASGRNRGPGPRGSNQAGVRAHNERVVLSLIRRHGELAKADIARLSGLSSQTASVIIRVLEADGLVSSGTPRRGRVGQPSVPMRLDPHGAFSLGLKIGRRTSEMVLTDFAGTILGHRAILYPFPQRAAVVGFAADAAASLGELIDPAERGRIVGLGVGMPAELWSWDEANEGFVEQAASWRPQGVLQELADATGFSVSMANDVTAACGAEQAFGSNAYGDYVYFFVGAFVGGGIVIDGRLVPGRLGNAGALGSLPVPDGRGGRHQLIEAASIHVLEKMAREAGVGGMDLWRGDSDWDPLGALLEDWIGRAGAGLAHAIVCATAIYDFEAAVIDGSFTPNVRARLVAATQTALAAHDCRGLAPVRAVPGSIGRVARELGAASLPFFSRYFLDHRVLYAEGALARSPVS